MFQPLKVLVIDDDPVVLQLTRGILASRGHNVLTHSDAFGSTQLIKAERPDVVLLDIEMPGLRGDVLLRLINKNKANEGEGPSVILFSGLPALELEELAKETGALGAISKSEDPTAFLAVFEQLTRDCRPRSGTAL